MRPTAQKRPRTVPIDFHVFFRDWPILHGFCMSKKSSCYSYLFSFYLLFFYMGPVLNKEGILKVVQISVHRTRRRIGQIKSEPRIARTTGFQPQKFLKIVISSLRFGCESFEAGRRLFRPDGSKRPPQQKALPGAARRRKPLNSSGPLFAALPGISGFLLGTSHTLVPCAQVCFHAARAWPSIPVALLTPP